MKLTRLELNTFIYKYNCDLNGINSKYVIFDFRSNNSIYDKGILIPTGNDNISILDTNSTKKDIHKAVKELEKMILDHLEK